MNEVHRDTPEDKVLYFMQRSDILSYEIRHQTRVVEHPLSFISNFQEFSQKLLLILTWFMNILMLCFYVQEDVEEYPVFDRNWVHPTLLVCAIIHLVFSGIMCISWIWNWAPIIVYKKHKDATPFSLTPSALALPGGKAPLDVVVNFFLGNPVSRTIRYLGTDTWFMYHFLFLAASCAGIRWFPLYSFHLIDFSIRNPQVQNVLKAVTTNGGSILRTAVVEITLMYIFSMLGFWFLQDTYNPPDSGIECDTLYKCFLSTIHGGLRAGGGIGDVLDPVEYGSNLYWGRFFFDMLFFIMIIIVLQNMVFGIILDTFGQLRDEKSELEEDKRNVCFICSNTSDVFQRQASGFKPHTKYEHNPWNYLFYFIYLDHKDPDEYTHAEQYISDLKAENEIDFFPVGKAISLEKFGEEEGKK